MSENHNCMTVEVNKHDVEKEEIQTKKLGSIEKNIQLS